MARLRSNFQRGTLTGSIGSGDTSISSGEFSALPVVASPDYLMIVLDPDAVHGNPEIVKVTAHTSSATSVTVVRAQEGTTNRSHNPSTTWRHVPTKKDWDYVDLVVNVAEFGALGDGSTDDTTAIQDAIASVATTTPRNGVEFLFPSPQAGKFYKVTDTLDFTDVWVSKIRCPNRYSFQQTFADADHDYALIHWYGATDTEVFLFDTAYGITAENISVNGRNVSGVTAFSLSQAATAVSPVKYFTGTHLDAKYCDVGIRVGDYTASGPDDAPVVLKECNVGNNATAGLRVNSGNAVVRADTLTALSNGGSPTGSGAELNGANVQLLAGQLTLTDYISGGTDADRDIYMNAGTLRVNGAWSEQIGPFVDSDNINTKGCYLNGVRHYEGSGVMTNGNTPYSINWAGPAQLVTEGCYLYNSVNLLTGQAGTWVDLGTEFVYSGAGAVLGDETSAILTGTKGGVFPVGPSGEGIVTLYGDVFKIHYVGTTGEPAFSNSWVNYGSVYTDVSFYMDASQVVHLSGLMKSGTINQIAFTLPSGYQPPHDLFFPVISNNAIGYVTVCGHLSPSPGSGVAGSVTCSAGNNTWVSLDGISFRVSQ